MASEKETPLPNEPAALSSLRERERGRQNTSAHNSPKRGRYFRSDLSSQKQPRRIRNFEARWRRTWYERILSPLSGGKGIRWERKRRERSFISQSTVRLRAPQPW